MASVARNMFWQIAAGSLKGLDQDERVIYVGTLNKALFPGLRIGYAVVPQALLSAFANARYLMDRQPPPSIKPWSPSSCAKDILQRISAACATCIATNGMRWQKH